MVATVLAAFNGNMAQPRTRNNVLSIMRRFSVTRNAPQLVSPSEPTPSGSLPLSATDNRPYFNTYEQTVHVYRHGREPAKVIKEALSRALVPYYPVAGRLRRSEHGNLEVDCTDNGGIGFVEASADCSLEDVNHFVDPPPLVIPAEQLLPTDVEKHQPIFLMQVTQFKCGGFTVGIKFSHAFFDGAGLAQFMNAVGEISRGLPQPMTKPIWFRESIIDPQEFTFTFSLAHGAQSFFNDLEQHVIDLSPEQINKLKNKFMKEIGKKCSTFEILAALVWQLRTRAINLRPRTDVTLIFPMNMRQHMGQTLQYCSGGYYGNLINLAVIKNTAAFVGEATLPELAKMVQDAKRRTIDRCSACLSHGFDKEALEIELSYLTLGVSDWRRLGVYDVDYGWGAPMHIMAHRRDLDSPVGVCEILWSPVFEGGVRLWTHSVWKKHLVGLLDQLKMVT